MTKSALVSRVLLVVAVTVVAAATVQGATYDVFFTEDMLSYTSKDGYDVVRLDGGRLLTREAHPMLPMWRVAISIPSDSRVGAFEIVPVEVETIEGDYWVYPASAPSRLSSAEPRKLSEPDRGIYTSVDPYPEIVGESVGEGGISGHRFATFVLYPLRFTPADHKLELVTHFRIELSTEPLGEPLELPAENALRERIFTERVKRLVINPENVEAHTVRGDVGRLQTGTVDYLVIAESGVASDYQPLVDWKTKKGLKCEIVSTSWIYSTYSGTDNEEKIRNCIKDYYLNHGTVYVLLGGDTGYVPAREGYCDIPEQGMSGEEIYLPCDLYYSDMDDDWNAGGDPNKWGEHPADNVDMYADVYVGRVPASSSSHVSSFVDRILIYEGSSGGSTGLPTGYLEDMLFLAEILWSSPYTDGGIAKNMIDDDYVPPRYDPITKLYESSGNLNFTSAMNALNAGQSIINHDGHANVPVLSVGPDALYNGDFDDLINAPEFGVFYTGGCWASAIDYNTISEHWINNPDGGGVAFVGNSRYGWGCPGYPGECVSDLYDQQFFRALFTSDLYNLGVTHADAKDYYVPDSKVDDYMRYALYEIILLGDPEMPIWTETPASLIAVHDATLPTGSSPFTVTVTSGGSPVVDATVCLWKGDEVHLVDDTNGSGVVAFSPDPTTTGTMYVTVTKHNYLPHEGSATVTAGDTEDPDVTVTAPDGGETWYVDSFFDITWSATDNVGVTSIDILLSTDGGATYPTTIATGEANDGVYSWQVDVAPTTQARVKVIAYDAAMNSGEDVSDADFTIADGTDPDVTVTQPNGGETWYVDSFFDIMWNATDNVGVTSVDILLSSDGGATYPHTITTGETNDGLYSWQVDVAPTTQARVKVIAYDAAGNDGEDVSDADFTIADDTDPDVTVSAPNGGEVMDIDSFFDVQWIATDNVGVISIDILLSTDGGATYPHTIATGEANDGLYSWQVDVAPTTQARVKVIAYDAAGNDGEDVSDANFTIADGTDPDVTVTEPDGGEVMDIDSFFDVQWIATDNIGVTSIDILLSTDGGATYPHTIATGEANDGVYSWQVDVAPTTQARVKVVAYDAEMNSGEDVSDANFTIADGESPEVTVTAPNGGEVWDIGEFYSITWVATDNIGVTSIDVLLSLDGGMTFPETIATGEVNDGIYDWYVDSGATTEARVKVVAHDGGGNSGEDASDADFEIYDPQSGVVEQEVPAGVVITGATPNPFSQRTSVRFGIPKDGSVNLIVYDVSGRQVADLADGYYPAGYHSVDWVAGGAVRTGIYFLSLRCGSEEVTRKVVISQ